MGDGKWIMLVVAAVGLRLHQSVVGQAVTTTTTLTKIPAVQLTSGQHTLTSEARSLSDCAATCSGRHLCRTFCFNGVTSVCNVSEKAADTSDQNDEEQCFRRGKWFSKRF